MQTSFADSVADETHSEARLCLPTLALHFLHRFTPHLFSLSATYSLRPSPRNPLHPPPDPIQCKVILRRCHNQAHFLSADFRPTEDENPSKRQRTSLSSTSHHTHVTSSSSQVNSAGPVMQHHSSTGVCFRVMGSCVYGLLTIFSCTYDLCLCDSSSVRYDPVGADFAGPSTDHANTFCAFTMGSAASGLE